MKLKEDMPTNSAGAGQVDGIGVGPKGEPGFSKSKVVSRIKELTKRKKKK